MRIIKKIIVGILVIMTTLTAVSCKKSNNQPSANTGIDKTSVIDNIVENGTSDYTILISETPSEAEKYAAEEFQNYANQVSGVTMDIEDESTYTAEANAKLISIGNTKALTVADFKVDYSQLNGDGFIMKTKNNALYINGASDRGTLYGVYDFFEKICGVRFLDINVEHVPTMDEIPLYKSNVVEIPTFKYRSSLTPMVYTNKYSTPDKQLAYSVKSRQTSEFLRSSSDGKYGGTVNINDNVNVFHNNLSYVLQGKTYSQFNAAHGGNCESMFYFGNNNPTPKDICYTNGINEDGSIDKESFNTATAYLEGMKHYISQNPHADYYPCKQETNKNCCACTSCADVAKRYDGNTTAAILRFYNAMAREIQAWADEELDGKEIVIVIFCYDYSRTAPVVKNAKGEFVPMDETVVLEDNVVVRFADYSESNHSYSIVDPNNASFGYGETYLERWKPLINKNWFFSFGSNHGWYFSWLGTFKKHQKNFLALAEIGCEYICIEYNYAEYNDWKTIMDNYVIAKLLWNPYQDAAALRNEFIELYYGVGADDVKALVKLYDDNYYAALEMDKGVFYAPYDIRYFSQDMWEEGLDLALSALEKIQAQTGKTEAQINDEILRAKRLQMTSLFALVYQRNIFYFDNESINQVTNDFFNLCAELGVQWYGKHLSIESLKEVYPLV